jgi:site-specific recombinase
MKIFLLKLRVFWRRMRRGAFHETVSNRNNDSDQLDSLLRQANPFASWPARVEWMSDIATWLRGGEGRLALLLGYLDAQRDMRRVVRTTLQKTMREAVGPDLFGTAGLPQEPAVSGELLQRLGNALLPRSPDRANLTALLQALFPRTTDFAWLDDADDADVSRLWRLCMDDGIVHALREQIDEALHYLAAMIIAIGVSPEFHQRLDARMPLQATPFMALRRELEKYLAGSAHNDVALRSVRMLIAVCQAQTDRIYAHLDEHGVSVSLVYRLERMRAQLARMARLIDIRATAPEHGLKEQVRSLLAELVDRNPQPTTMSAVLRRSFALLARKTVERNAETGEPHSVLGAAEYRRMLIAGCRGGFTLVLAVLARAGLPAGGAARFIDGAVASSGYAVIFGASSGIGGVVGGRLPATVTPALAARAESLETIEGLRRFAAAVASAVRAQIAAVAGNLVVLVPLVATVVFVWPHVFGTPLMGEGSAQDVLRKLHAPGRTLLYAAFTGVLLWLSSLIAGFADNWFALRRMREAFAQQRRIVRVLGQLRARRWAEWLERHIASIAGSISLGVLFGMTPAVAGFLGLPFEVRHVVLTAGDLATAVTTLGLPALKSLDTWLALGGVLTTGLLNVGCAIACAVALGLRSRGISRERRRMVYMAVLRCILAGPRFFLLPESSADAVATLPVPPAAVARTEEERRSGLGGR